MIASSAACLHLISSYTPLPCQSLYEQSSLLGPEGIARNGVVQFSRKLAWQSIGSGMRAARQWRPQGSTHSMPAGLNSHRFRDDLTVLSMQVVYSKLTIFPIMGSHSAGRSWYPPPHLFCYGLGICRKCRCDVIPTRPNTRSMAKQVPRMFKFPWLKQRHAGEDPSSLRRRNAIQLRRWATRARSPSKAAKLAKVLSIFQITPTPHLPRPFNSLCCVHLFPYLAARYRTSGSISSLHSMHDTA